MIDGWQMALAAPGGPMPTHGWIAAPVPGTAAEALRNSGLWDDAHPTPLHDKDVWYRVRFAGGGRRLLRFEGLATIAEAWLNGTKILDSDNMFLAHEVEVDLGSDNALLIAFRSLDRALEQRQADRKRSRARWRTRLVEDNALRLVRTTLLGHMTGWTPPVHAVGPWRSITLLERNLDVDLRASLDGDDGVVEVSLRYDGEAAVLVGDRSAPLARTDDGRLAGKLRLPNVEKWWPHTHGKAALHAVKLRTAAGEIDLGRTGFRSIAVDRDSDGKGFALVVNGVKIFARGACWSAADLVSLAGDRQRLAPWLALARDAHMNMVRVGGTMTYESDDFFTLCDELGLLIWHDFMFANMDYPIADPAFRASVETEAAQFLRRTRRHPSLAVLCGGSEVAQQVAMMGLPAALWTSPLYEEVLSTAVATLRPDVPYVPHSPVGGDLPFATDAGISHYYGVGAYRRPLEDARRAKVRFTSECLGFANVPEATSPGVPWDDPERWQAAVPRDRGADWDFEDVTNHYVRLLYGPDARGLDAARAATAEVMEATIAEWRRAGSSCWGALVWMLKDFVPGAGWGVIDANGLPKPAWHALRRAFRPIQVALTDEGLNGLGIHLINETVETVRARLSLRCFGDGDTVTMRRERDVELAPRSNQTLTSAELIGSFFDITWAYRFGPPPLKRTEVALDDASGVRLAGAQHFPLGRVLTPS
ncbi:MAG: glycoside hydrolase family 2 protein [Proteobacteria bacterium]|nr:glycoside hydrolase family 2 protein [Pseudomonadota bacterium]